MLSALARSLSAMKGAMWMVDAALACVLLVTAALSLLPWSKTLVRVPTRWRDNPEGERGFREGYLLGRRMVLVFLAVIFGCRALLHYFMR
jgi:hypothetical protein